MSDEVVVVPGSTLSGECNEIKEGMGGRMVLKMAAQWTRGEPSPLVLCFCVQAQEILKFHLKLKAFFSRGCL